MKKLYLSFAFILLAYLNAKAQTVIADVNDLYMTVATLVGGETIHLVPSVTYTLTSTLNISKNCIIDGHGATINTSTFNRLINITGVSSGNVTLKNLHLTGGNITGGSGSAVLATSSNLVLEGCEVNSCVTGSSSSSEGAIASKNLISENHTLSMSNCYIHNNTGAGVSVGIGGTGGISFSISNSTFAENTTQGFYSENTVSGSYSLSNCTFFNNCSMVLQSSIYFEHTAPSSILNVNHCTVVGSQFCMQAVAATITCTNSLLKAGAIIAITSSGGIATIGADNIQSASASTITGLATSLANNGGFAPTLSIDINCTVAINNASAGIPISDQRGALYVGNSDIGAYEYNGEFSGSSLLVTNTNPFGVGSLYAAINNANNNPAASTNTITFNILTTDINYQVVTTHWRIQPITGTSGGWSAFIKDTNNALPIITHANTTINGQAIQNTNTILNSNTAFLKIELNGEQAGATSNGLVINAASCTLTDLNINKFNGIGIRLEATANNATIRGCFIGTDIRGNATGYGNTSDGIYSEYASNITVGGTLPAFQNIISGNTIAGIAIVGGGGHTLQGNTVGLNATKITAIPNGLYGIAITNAVASSASIGGIAVGASNLISGNGSNGIYIQGTSYLNIYKNYVGINGIGTPIASGSEGIRITGNSTNINIGNGGLGGRNVISNINIFESGGAPDTLNIIGNHIGLSLDGVTTFTGVGGMGVGVQGINTKNIYISQNTIVCHVNGGIQLTTSGNEGVTPPIITQASTGAVTGTANANAVIEIYADATTCTPKQGQVYLGSITANATGDWTFTSAALATRLGQAVTAIQHAGNLKKSTSAFSAPLIITNNLPTSTNITVSVLEDIPTTIEKTDITFADVDATDTFWGVKIETLPITGSGNLRYIDAGNNLQIVTPNTKYELSAGTTTKRLIYTTDGNIVGGMPPITFTFRVIDSPALDSSAFIYTSLINVIPVNDEPTLDIIPQQQPISDNSNPVILTLTGVGKGGGIDEITQNLTFTATSSDPDLIADPIIAYTGGTSTTATLTYEVLQNVTQNTTVTITLRLKDDAGTLNAGIDSLIRTFTVNVVPNLPAPYSLQVASVSETALQLYWSNDDPNTSGLTYEIYRATEVSPDDFVLISLPTVGLSATNTALTPNTLYYYKVRSVSGIGYSAFSNISGARTVPVSAAPSLLIATVLTKNKIALTWQDNSTTISEAGFYIERYSLFTNSFALIATLPANTTAYIDSIGLLPNVDYTYKMRSFTIENENSPYSNQAIATTLIDPNINTPTPPFNLEATSVSEQQINLRWEYSISPTTIYVIERSPILNNNFTPVGQFISAELTTVKNYIDVAGLTSLPPTTLYHYRIRARTGGGISTASNEDTASTRCNLQNLAIVRTDNGKAIICDGKSASMSVVSKVRGATYQWRYNGLDINEINAKFETYYATETGVYSCYIKAGNCQSISVNTLFVAVLNSPDALTILRQDGELVASLNDADSYQWYYDYKPLTGATARNYKPTKIGVYYVVAEVESCSSTSPTFFFGVLANENENINAYITIAPNPAQQQASLKLNIPTIGHYTIRLLDTKGKTIYTQAGKKENLELQANLPIQNLPAGLYVVEITIANRRGYKKLVKE